MNSVPVPSLNWFILFRTRGLTFKISKTIETGDICWAGWRTLYGNGWLSIILKSFYHNKYQYLIVFWPRSLAMMWSYVMSYCPSVRSQPPSATSVLCEVWIFNMKQFEKVTNVIFKNQESTDDEDLCICLVSDWIDYWDSLLASDWLIVFLSPPPDVWCLISRQCQWSVSAKCRAPGLGAQRGQYS